MIIAHFRPLFFKWAFYLTLLLSLSLSLFSPKSTSRQLDVDSGGEQCFFILGSSESKGQWVRSHWVQGWYRTETVNVKWNSVPLHIFLCFSPNCRYYCVRRDGATAKSWGHQTQPLSWHYLRGEHTSSRCAQSVKEVKEPPALRSECSPPQVSNGSGHIQCGFSDLRMCTYGSRLDCFRLIPL